MHITDTPPPASASSVQKKQARSARRVPAQEPYDLTLAKREFPVTLYTAPGCSDPCRDARALLNRRGVPFKEVQMADESSHQELKRVSGATDVPTLLDSARYPRGY